MKNNNGTIALQKTDTRLIDSHMRRINYLRISITDRCNLRCIYCVPGQPISRIPHKSILSYEEILKIVRIGTRLGITKVRVTGGEPLVRKDCIDFISRLTQINGLKDISLTTNGLLLSRYLEPLADAGISRVNISLDTLYPEKYKAITGIDGFDRVWKAIHKAIDMGFSPVKINVVAMRGVNDDEINDLAGLSRDYPLHVRFIELMPFGKAQTGIAAPMLEDEILGAITQSGGLTPISRNKFDGPAKKFKFNDSPGEIGIISPVSHHFCKTCNRLRLTADGRIRMCLLSDESLDIRAPLRSGTGDNELAETILHAVAKKPFIRCLGVQNPPCRTMSAIGG
ncbi:MAG: GTP 3',8-cyclase MoaA [Deltaproteobacteria bacterium]|nr:GTP 3',8-cyclase MoaA [Deltaproteobacteria bacterium]